MQLLTSPMPLSPEVIDDRVATVLEAGANITLNYDDAANMLTISAASGGTSYTDKQAQDAVGNILQDSATIDYVYNDATPYITGLVKDNSITESMLSLSDNTTKDASISSHGLLMKLSGNTVHFLRGDGTWVTPPTGASYTNEEAQDAVGTILVDSARIDFTYNDATPSITADIIAGSITEAQISLSDVTADNATISAHGFLPKLSGIVTEYLNGSGVWSTPPIGGGASAALGATVQTSTAQTITTGAAVTINYETETRDDASFWSAGNPSRLTVPSAGWYSISSYILWGTTSSAFRKILIRINGTTIIAQDVEDAGTTNQSQTISTIWYLQATDYVEIQLQHGAAGSYTIVSGNFSIVGLTAAPTTSEDISRGVHFLFMGA